MKFVVIHGSFGSPEENWFPELKEKLESLGQEVIVPQFPVESWSEITKNGPAVKPTRQSVDRWLEVFEPVVKSFRKTDKLCFIGHSLGPVFILHAVERFNLQLDSAIFVSPFMDMLKSEEFWQFDFVNASFYKTDFDFEMLKKRIPVSYVLYSDSDPYVSKTHSVLFAKALDSSQIFIKKAGHMNSEVNMNEFPLVFDLCTSRLDLSLYQRYLEHRRNLYAMEYVKNKPEGSILLRPEEIIDEGVFHFSHLAKEGFCTFLAKLETWDPKGKYFEDARKAARRVKNFTRVFIISSKEELKKKELCEQIRLDLEAGISVYFCRIENLDMIPDPDFGIWDDDYVCTIRFDKTRGVMKEIELNSTRDMMKRAREWQHKIMDHAVRIQNATVDIEKFLKKFQ